jgi:hypothetical protein
MRELLPGRQRTAWRRREPVNVPGPRLPRLRPGNRRLGVHAGPLVPRRYLIAAGLLTALVALIALIALVPSSPHPTASVPPIHTPTVKVHPPHPQIGPPPSISGPGLSGEGGPSESRPSGPEPVTRVQEKDIEQKPVVVSEATVHHPHHAGFDLSLLALAFLTLFVPPFLKRRRSTPKILRRMLWPLGLVAAVALVIASVHIWESPDPPKLVSLHTIQFHPELIPEGVESHRNGNTIHVVHRFTETVPERKLLHVHVWAIYTSWQLPLALLAMALAGLLIGDRLVPLLRRPGRGPPAAPTPETTKSEPRRT